RNGRENVSVFVTGENFSFFSQLLQIHRIGFILFRNRKTHRRYYQKRNHQRITSGNFSDKENGSKRSMKQTTENACHPYQRKTSHRNFYKICQIDKISK